MKENDSTRNEEVGEEMTKRDDMFNLQKLRLSQDFAQEIMVKKVVLTIPVRKPNRQEFIRVRPEEEWRLQTCVLTLKEDRETYLVEPDLWPELSGEVVPTILFTTINRQKVTFLWPVRLPNTEGRHDHWSKSALGAADMAQETWIRLESNLNLGAYEPYVAQGDIPEPEWPEISFQDILSIAFKDRFIRNSDHPVIRRLRGLS